MWIVKIGGSLAEAPELEAWLAAVAAAGRACLVVPGGGPFADGVRALQRRLRFDDGAAHRMALLAMQQYGLLLHAREPRLRLVETRADIDRLRADGAAGLWLPWALFGRDPAIPATWEATSDSMALLLAARIRADGLVLVKSAPLADREATAERLAAKGLVDAAFPRLLPGLSAPVALAHRDRPGDLAAVLAGETAGCRVLTA